METHRFVTMENGLRIHFREEGREHDQTLVLLHGFLQSLDVWTGYILTYMRRMRVLAIDLPGHGQSDTFSEEHSMEFMADAVKAVLDEAGVDQCVMLGHSMGGYVALAFAERYPYNLRGLALMHSHAEADSSEAQSGRLDACEQLMSNKPSYVLRFVPELFSSAKRVSMEFEIKELCEQCLDVSVKGAVAAQLGMFNRKDRQNVLAHLEVPVLFVIGKDDPRYPFQKSLVEATLPQYCEVMLLSNVAHMAFMEERDYVKIRIANFVSTCFA